ncbi:Leucine Rich Repeat [Seminavis robusta]|uniref:Leucine Rich Repeat n=1 Tax=Seminavis robusta TaxID=568900 RepID=A0A9N8EG57_9STRA|nr:Leucine Rich Repeat [Seminavis robusta]|eukprot:Sro1109_g242310.1 Leucine Rich Repeat (749) ;mRNA; f:21496-23742
MSDEVKSSVEADSTLSDMVSRPSTRRSTAQLRFLPREKREPGDNTDSSHLALSTTETRLSDGTQQSGRTGTVALGHDAILSLTETSYRDVNNDGQAKSPLGTSSNACSTNQEKTPTLTRTERENKGTPTHSPEHATGPRQPPTTTRAEQENKKDAKSKNEDPDQRHVHQELSATDLGMIVATSSFRHSNRSSSEPTATAAAAESEPGAFRQGAGSLIGGSSHTIVYNNEGSVLRQPSVNGPELVTAFIVEENEPEKDLEAVKESLRKELREEIMQDVVEADNVEVQIAQDDGQNAHERAAGKNRRMMILAGLAVLLLVVIISVAVSVGSKSSDGNEEQEPQEISVNATDAPTLAPSSAPTFYFDLALMEGLPNFTLASLQNQTSPQSMAYQWVSSDPDLSSYNNSRRLQRFALATLYFATEGEKWEDQNWLHYGSEKNECTWFSQEDETHYPEFSSKYYLNHCSNDMEYVFLTPWDNGLGGTLPPELSLLTKLQIMDLSYGAKAGTIPTELGLLTDLRQLWFVEMGLTGTVATELFSLTKLKRFSVESTPVSGWIPTEVGQLTSLELLSLYDMDLEGPIPSEIGLLSHVVWAYVDSNRLTSTIPTEFGLATSLDTFEGYNNQLTGTLPSELGQLQVLDRFLLYSNQLTSTIPSELRGLPFLSELQLDDNFLEGNVDNMTFASQQLKTFHIQGNIMLTGTIPTGLCMLGDGLEFDCSPGHLCGCSSCDCDLFNNSAAPTWNVTGDDLSV